MDTAILWLSQVSARECYCLNNMDITDMVTLISLTEQQALLTNSQTTMKLLHSYIYQ